MSVTYVCERCGEVFEPETAPKKFGNVICGVDVDGEISCPRCGSLGVEEAARCKVCGGYFREDILTCGICEECLEAVSEPENLIAICDMNNDKADLELNFALVSILKGSGFDPEEILTSFTLEKAKDPLYGGKIKGAARQTAAREIDLSGFG